MPTHRSSTETAGISTTSQPAITGFGREFTPFLQLQLWEEKNGMPLSILSAFARLDLDPWQEAETLAQMPSEAASRRLSERLRLLPGSPGPTVNRDLLCAHALCFLPARPTPRAPANGAVSPSPSRARGLRIFEIALFASMLMFYAILVVQLPRDHGPGDHGAEPRSNPASAAHPRATAP